MNQIWQIGLIGLIGLCFGSFLNVLIYRLNNPKAPKFWQGRSICPKCKNVLKIFDNIPLLSFVFLRGKCRFCHQKISWQYPIVELFTGIITFLLFPNIYLLLIAYCFIVIFFSDLIYGLIPDEMIILGIILTVILSGAKDLIVGFLTALPFFIFSKFKLMGEGDIGLAFLTGLILGWPKIIIALWSAFILGGATAIILLLLRKTKLSATIPLGPFLILGTLIAALWSEKIVAILLLN